MVFKYYNITCINHNIKYVHQGMVNKCIHKRKVLDNYIFGFNQLKVR